MSPVSRPEILEVVVPATSANLGPGFDSLGLALGLYNRAVIRVGGRADRWQVKGEGAAELNGARENLLLRAADTVYEAMGEHRPPWEIRMENEVPLSRGLGSSATAVVAGVLAANAFLGEPLPLESLLQLCTRLEGHPDNVGAALLGGLVVTAMTGERVQALSLGVPRELTVVAWVPQMVLSTREARAVLPDRIPRSDAIFNVQHAALLVASLARGDYTFLAEALDDRLHQPYRARLVPGFEDVLAAAREAGAYGAYLSGAGSTIVALAPAEAREALLATLTPVSSMGAEVLALEIDGEGARCRALTDLV